MTEWSKVYDMVVKFRDTLVAMFTESAPHLAGLVEDLQTMEVHQLDRSQEVQGQITQMRSVGAPWLTFMKKILKDELYIVHGLL